jgi:2-desacetyl-2-hydroxyethyl bacteriochlorophyllide A dehydrogenase
VVPGHEFAGGVVKVGSQVTRVKPGDRAAVEPNIACGKCYNCLHNRQNFCLNWQAIGVTRPGAMAEYVVAPEENIFKIGDLAFEQGAFVEPLSCVIHGVERAEIRAADRVAILGAGPIGILHVQLVLSRGAADVTVLEQQAARAQLAEDYGAHHVVRQLDDLSDSAYDVVIDATGALPVMSKTVAWARKGGMVLLFGVPPRGAELALDAFAIFEKGLTIRSSYTSLRNSYQAVDLLRSGVVNVSDLISHRLPLSRFEEGVQLIEQGLEDVKKVLIVPDS